MRQQNACFAILHPVIVLYQMINHSLSPSFTHPSTDNIEWPFSPALPPLTASSTAPSHYSGTSLSPDNEDHQSLLRMVLNPVGSFSYSSMSPQSITSQYFFLTTTRLSTARSLRSGHALPVHFSLSSDSELLRGRIMRSSRHPNACVLLPLGTSHVMFPEKDIELSGPHPARNR